MAHHTRSLIAATLVLVLTGCRFSANRPTMPSASVRPASGVSTQPVLPTASPLAASPASGSAASASAALAIPLVARIVRDLRHLPQDLAVARDGTTWLLAADGIWQRPSDDAAWTLDAPLTACELPAAPGEPPAEIATDPAGVPWILDPATGRIWQHKATGDWQLAASGLGEARGLSVAADGTAYAVASDATATVWKVTAGKPEPLRDATWKHPVATAVDANGALLVVDDVYRAVHRYGTTQKLAAIPPSLGRLTIGRDNDGTPLIVGGVRGVIAMRVQEKSLGFPLLPTTSLPTAGAEGFKALRLFSTVPDRYVVIARIETAIGTIGEFRVVTAIGRKPGQVYQSSAAYIGKALALRAQAAGQVASLGSGYQLFRIRGTGKSSDATNRGSSWQFDYWNGADHSIATITMAAQGVTLEKSLMPDSLPAPAPLPDQVIESDLAWADAVKSGMPNQIAADMDLSTLNGTPFWRISWTTGGQTYRVNAATGEAGLETSPTAAAG